MIFIYLQNILNFLNIRFSSVCLIDNAIYTLEMNEIAVV